VGIAGVNWNVKLMGVKFLNKSGSGTLENAIRAINYATDNGAQIMNNSWGGGAFSELLKQSIERSREKGVL
ncbi:MAG: S8 family serine peptidase, partial [Bdellovibrionota bacterium]